MTHRLAVLASVEPSANRPVTRGSARGPVALLSLHSHRDRSFLDDVVLHELSGELRAAGLENDLVVACITDAAGPELSRLAGKLASYPTVVYERVWSAELIRRLAGLLPGATWVRVHGEHALEDAPADAVCRPSELVSVVAELLDREVPSPRPMARPNLAPVYVADEDRPARPSYPIKGSSGCPYGADARENDVFAGLAIPERYGRGCSFCTTGNAYEHKRPADALATTLDQLRYARTEAPWITTLVLRDQNPFAYLTELVEAAEKERLGPFTLLVESRADWWLQNAKRFERALEAARRSTLTIAPFLVGIENFSQPELDRFNKGIAADVNVRFLHQLHAWAEAFGSAMDLSHGAFGFILFSPWTTLVDLEENLRCIEETRLHEHRGRLLLSRARLYPDTALYYLAERDGLLLAEYESATENSSARYGYLPAHPWRFADPLVARIAELAAEVLAARGYRNEMAVFRALMSIAKEDPSALRREVVEARLEGPSIETLKASLAALLVRAPRIPIALPKFGLELRDLEVDGRDVLVTFGRGTQEARVRVGGPNSIVVERSSDALLPVAQRIAARMARFIDAERWAAAEGLVRSLATQRRAPPPDA